MGELFKGPSLIPILVCTVGSKSLSVFEASCRAYAPQHSLIIAQGSEGSFGADYNKIMLEAFKFHDEVIIANDDVVLNPWTVESLLTDVQKLKPEIKDRLGVVSVLSDYVRWQQNIRYKFREEDQLVQGKWQTERVIRCVEFLSPILAWVPKKAFEVAQFPPINLWSDDVWLKDLTAKGFMHFVSTAYVHHVGQQSIGFNDEKLYNDAKPWMIANRPKYFMEFTGENISNSLCSAT